MTDDLTVSNHDVPVEGGPFEGLLTKIKDLDPELRMLLLYGILQNTARNLGVVADGRLSALQTVVLTTVRNCLELGNHVLHAEIDSHEDWTRTGDRRVDAIWDEWVELLDSLRLTPDDLPPEVAERISKNEATEDDLRLVQDLMAKKTGVPADALDPNEIRVAHMSDLREGLAETKDEPGTGQYL